VEGGASYVRGGKFGEGGNVRGGVENTLAQTLWFAYNCTVQLYSTLYQ